MIPIKSAEQVELIRLSSLLVSETLAEVARSIRPGMTTLRLDKIADAFIHDHGGEPSFKGYRGFPNAICASVNEAVVHGIPDERPIKEGDLVSIDCGIRLNGFHGDSAYTFGVGELADELRLLLEVTYECLWLGIRQAAAGNRVGDIGYAIQSHAEGEHGFGVVRQLVGHGIGQDLHESPEVPNFGRRGRGPKLREGMVVAIEPMINLGDREVVTEKDGWTVVTVDSKPSAHYEHTVEVAKGSANVLSSFGMIEAAVAKNSSLQATGNLKLKA